MHISLENGERIEFEGFSIEVQVKLLGLVAEHLKYDEETQCKFTAALNAFTKLKLEDKKREVNVWIKVMENIIREGDVNEESKKDQEGNIRTGNRI